MADHLGAPGAERLMRIAETCREILVSASNINRSMLTVVEKVTALTGAQGAAITLPEGDEMVCVAASRRVQDALRIREPLAGSLSGSVYTTGDVRMEKRPSFDTETLLGVPLREKGRVAGTLVVFSKAQHTFAMEDVAVVTMLAEIAGAAIEHARIIEHTYRESRNDALTGLHNRRAFDEHVTRELTRLKRYNVPFSLIMFDLDNFKGINDRYGHVAGDETLRCVAEIMASQMRDTDCAFRFGGDEFAIVCSSTNQAQGIVAAERITKALHGATLNKYAITACYGVSEAHSHDDILRLEGRADAALYKAKRNVKRSDPLKITFTEPAVRDIQPE